MTALVLPAITRSRRKPSLSPVPATPPTQAPRVQPPSTGLAGPQRQPAQPAPLPLPGLPVALPGALQMTDVARPYLKKNPETATNKGLLDAQRLLNTPVNVPLAAIMGQLPPTWW